MKTPKTNALLRANIRSLRAQLAACEERNTALQADLNYLRKNAIDEGCEELTVCSGCGALEGDCGCPCGTGKRLVNSRANKWQEVATNWAANVNHLVAGRIALAAFDALTKGDK